MSHCPEKSIQWFRFCQKWELFPFTCGGVGARLGRVSSPWPRASTITAQHQHQHPPATINPVFMSWRHQRGYSLITDLGGIKLQSAVTKVIALVCISYNSKNLSSSDCFFNGTCKIFFIGSSLDWRLGKQTKNPFEEIIKLWVIPINIAEMDHYKYTHKILCWPDCIWPTCSCHVHTAATRRRLLWPQVEPISCL